MHTKSLCVSLIVDVRSKTLNKHVDDSTAPQIRPTVFSRDVNKSSCFMGGYHRNILRRGRERRGEKKGRKEGEGGRTERVLPTLA